MKKRGPYVAEVGGHSWSRNPRAEFETVRECRDWAESYGGTADYCSIYDANSVLVGRHRCDPSGRGQRWFRAAV